jgi:hypothetical protein
MPPSRKKVIIRKLDAELLFGYLPPADFLEQSESGLPHFGLLDLDGNVTVVPAAEVKWICFVRDFNSNDLNQPERLSHKTFHRRPRSPGLWLRARLKDNDSLEGLARNDLSLFDNMGLLLIPPDTRSNTQRIFVPLQAIAEVEILAVVKVAASRTAERTMQESLFKP